ncbi:MAG: DUF2723 domain-containing protein [Caldilineaceae bacterium]
MALTAGLLYLLMTRLLPTGSWGRLSALFAALLFTLNPTFWSQNIIAEVYALECAAGGRGLVGGAGDGGR